ncbi:MAG TPA: hypothetical protein VHS76_12140 [Steroidobacteraceae bacterium]|nr:hypothetical protein [Steroidobacteraceae bacterium]
MRQQGGSRTRLAHWVLVAIAMLSPPHAHAVSVETLLMPGKVTRAHEKLESNCSNCHDRSSPHGETVRCLECHKEIAADVQMHRGYHGRMANAAISECRACHTEHRGRDADIVQMSRSQFDHSLTEFELQGAHANLACESCHKSTEPWRKAPTDCSACHKGDDAHHGQFSQGCGECHSALSWTGGRFDHDKVSFKLSGAHTSLSCDACHLGGRYQAAPKSCSGCHATDDVHRGSRGEECAKCHTSKEWTAARFDHLKETGYDLQGAHEKLNCLSCHRSGNYKDPVPKDCNGCHRADDAHGTRFGAACADCHDNSKWRVAAYDHEARHKFPLQGVHAKIDCDACHTAVIAKQKLGQDCVSCHRSEDPHGGSLKQACSNCHGQQSWSSGIAFDHDLTSYPLLGLHRVVSCAQCHASMTFKEAPITCIACHAQQDVHKGGLGKQCESCHSTNGWPLWSFDHAKQTHFALVGGHANLSCAACHLEPPGTAKTPSVCASCHRQDDRHLGEYGAQCDRCHTTYSWKRARVQ